MAVLRSYNSVQNFLVALGVADMCHHLLKFIYYEKATKFCEIFSLLLTVCTLVKSKVKISQNFVAFSEYMNFTFPISFDLDSLTSN